MYFSACEARRAARAMWATQSHPALSIVDDLALVVLGLRTVAEALALLAIIEAWECWHATNLSPEITEFFLGGPTFFLRV